MYVIDMHCDTISEIYKSRKRGEQAGLLSNHFKVNIQKLRQGGYMLQNFAIYTDIKKDGEAPYLCAKNQIELFWQELKEHAIWIRAAKTFEDIERNWRDGRISAVLTIEEGEICEGSLKKLREFYHKGVRMMTFTWNYENSLAANSGLTELGTVFLKEMEDLGIIADVSHLSDAGFYDVCRHSTKPFVASHSNARALCGHQRNLTDDMIRNLAERGGVIGINFYGLFLQELSDTMCCGRIEHIAAHIKHMIHTGGVSCVGLGSDFDGFSGKTELTDCSEIELLIRELRKSGLTSSEIDHVLYRNVLRVYKECWN